MVNPPLIRLIFCLAHLSSNMSVLASVSISSNVRKGMFIFNATFLEALYSYLFLYGALLNASSFVVRFFFVFSDHWSSDTDTPYFYYKVVNSIGRLKYTTKFLTKNTKTLSRWLCWTHGNSGTRVWWTNWNLDVLTFRKTEWKQTHSSEAKCICKLDFDMSVEMNKGAWLH